MKFKQQITGNKFSLVVSLPANNLHLAQAALEGGAQAIKVHCNVWHRASGHTFGTYSQNKQFLADLVALCGDIPVGLVPGGEDAFVTDEERLQLESLGVDFFSSYAHHLPPYMMDSDKLTKMVAIDSSYNSGTLQGVKNSGIDVLECSIQPGENYATALQYADLLRYTDIAYNSGKPCLIPTQRAILPSEVRHLYAAGCKAIMIGATVMGKDPTPENCKTATTNFRNAIEAL